MSWKQMTIGKKIAVGFGVILILLAIVGGLSFTGVSNIVRNAEQVIEGNKLDGNLAQKEVDHLNWAGKVNALLTDASVTSLEVQTDPHQCAFGKWLYGDGRAYAEKLIPQLAPLFKEIEEPHRKLHESAIAIKENFQVADITLPGFLAAKEADHLRWVATINELFLKNLPELVIETDDHKCSLGRWLYGDGAKKASEGKPELARLLEELKIPHARLHKTAIDIQKVYRQDHPGLLITLKDRLDDHRRWAAKVADAMIQDRAELDVETDPTKCAFGRFLVSDQLKEWEQTFPGLKRALKKAVEPHQKLHESAKAIQKALASGNMPGAKRAFASDALPALEAISMSFSEAISAEQELTDRQDEARKIYETRTLSALEETALSLSEVKKQAEWLMEGVGVANHIYSQESLPALHKVQELLNSIRSEAKKHIMTDEVMLDAAQMTKRNVSITGGIAIIIGILLAFVIARGIVGVLRKISGQMEEGSDQVAAASGQVSSASQSLAEGASEQAASIEQTSSSMEEMSSMTRQNSANAGQADMLMKETIDAVNRANKSMEDLTVSMKDISKASEETSKIIKTIDEIAFQTNLLALNAAVEAARAGEAGAGFAVVAEEVRNLAMRSAEAAKNTAQLIEGTVKKVNDGASLVETTNITFEEVARSAVKVGELIGEVTAASEEQSAGIEQVNLAIAEMDKVVQQNASTAEESASASEELSAQAISMKEVVDDLMIMVGGSHGKKKKGKTRPRAGSSRQQKLPKPVNQDRTRKLTSKSGSEIRPEQVIPFDDDEDFTDF